MFENLPTKVSREEMLDDIIGTEFHRYSETGTLCVITVTNGFTFTGQSACVDPNEFDEEIGKQMAYNDAVSKMWEPYGFLLKQRRHEASLKQMPDDGAVDFGTAVTLLKEGHLVAREGWNGKGMYLKLVRGEGVTTTYTPHEYEILDAIYMKTADNKMVPWLASQTDVLSTDWVLVQ